MSEEEARKKLIEYGFCDFNRPWMINAAERLEKDGHYADYAAWEDWMANQAESSGCSGPCAEGRLCVSCTMADWWDNLDIIVRTRLYTIFCEVASSAQNANQP